MSRNHIKSNLEVIDVTICSSSFSLLGLKYHQKGNPSGQASTAKTGGKGEKPTNTNAGGGERRGRCTLF
jgi:hypothetical protein